MQDIFKVKDKPVGGELVIICIRKIRLPFKHQVSMMPGQLLILIKSGDYRLYQRVRTDVSARVTDQLYSATSVNPSKKTGLVPVFLRYGSFRPGVEPLR